MDILKYPHFENTDSVPGKKELDYWLNLFPELQQEVFAIQEKANGSNIRAYIDPGVVIPYTLGTRESVLTDDQDFHEARVILEAEIKDFVLYLRGFSIRAQVPYTLYMEFVGPGVLPNPVYYGPGKHLYVLDIRVGEKMLSPKETSMLIDSFQVEQKRPFIFVIPTFALVTGLEAAMNFNIDRDSAIPLLFGENREKNLIEGIVIKSFNKVYTDSLGKTFMLKKKNTWAKEEVRIAKPVIIQNKQVEIIQQFILDSYVNQARVDSYFSKYGTIVEAKQIGEYVKGILADVMIDFAASDMYYDYQQLPIGDRKKITNIGKFITPFLRAVLVYDKVE
jgi:hypothetical protein